MTPKKPIRKRALDALEGVGAEFGLGPKSSRLISAVVLAAVIEIAGRYGFDLSPFASALVLLGVM